MREHLGTALTAAEYVCIGQVTDDTPDGGVMPHLAAAGPVALVI